MSALVWGLCAGVTIAAPLLVALGWDDAQRGRLIMEGDWHYLDGPEGHRPMCGGIWLDWTPREVSS